MGVFHTIAMFCTMGALSLNNSSQNCHHLQTPHSSCWQSSSTFQLLCAISTTVFSRLSAESRNTSFSTAPKRTALEYSISSSILARPEAFSHSKIPTHLFPRATPPLISTDDQPTLPPTFSHRPFLTDLSFTNTSSTSISSANPSLTKLNFPTPTTLCESSTTLSTFATRDIRASPKQCLSSSTASLQDPRSHLKPVRNCLFSFLQLGIPRC